MHCPTCNEILPLSARACYNCGATVTRDATPAERAEPPEPPRVTPVPLSKLKDLPPAARTTRSTSLRDRPFASAREVTQVPAGTVVTVLSEQLGFIGVELEDRRRGFVAEQDATLLYEPPPAAARPAVPAPEPPRPFPEPAPEPVSRAATAEPARPQTLSAPAASSVAPAARPHATPPARPTTPRRPPTTVLEQRLNDIAQRAQTAAPAPPRPDATAEARLRVDPTRNAPATGPVASPRRQRTAPAAQNRPEGEAPQAAGGSELPFNIPLMEGERVRYRAVFLYNPLEDQFLVVTTRRLIISGGTLGGLPKVLHLDEIESVRLLDSRSGSTNGEGSLFISVVGVPGVLHVGGVHMPHYVRNEILAASTEARLPQQRITLPDNGPSRRRMGA